MDELAAEVVARLYALRGSGDERCVARPTEDDVGEALLRASSAWESVPTETEIIESVVRSIKDLVDSSTPSNPMPLLASMEIARRALSQLHGLSASRQTSSCD
jgi:hypothetical protein